MEVIFIVILLVVLILIGLLVYIKFYMPAAHAHELHQMAIKERLVKLYEPRVLNGFVATLKEIRGGTPLYKIEAFKVFTPQPTPMIDDGQGDVWRDAVAIVTESIRQNGTTSDRLIPGNAWTSGGDWQAAKNAMAAKGWIVAISEQGKSGTFTKDGIDLAALLQNVTLESAMRHMTPPAREGVGGQVVNG